MSARRTVRVAVVALALVAVTACSNRESPSQKRPHQGAGTASAVAGGQEITITTGSDYRFHPATITVHPGTVRVILVNQTARGGGGAPHDLSVTGFPAAFLPLTPAGHSSSARFTAPSPGRYRFVCTIHVAQGQTGTLVVAP